MTRQPAEQHQRMLGRHAEREQIEDRLGGLGVLRGGEVAGRLLGAYVVGELDVALPRRHAFLRARRGEGERHPDPHDQPTQTAAHFLVSSSLKLTLPE